MKKTIICLVLLCALLLPACQSGKDSSKSSVSDQPSAPTSSSTTESDEGSLSDFTTPDEPIDFDALRQLIYDEMYMISNVMYTIDYTKEFLVALEAEWGETSSEYQKEHLSPRAITIDPFSERIVPTADVEKITQGMPLGKVMDMFGTPNYMFFWFIDMSNLSDTDLGGHWFYILDTGELLRISCDGRRVFDGGASEPKLNPGTAVYHLYPDGYHEFYVDRIDVLSVEDVLQTKDFYRSKNENTLYACGESRINPRINRWPFREWPEIFVTKYGLE